MNLQEAMREQAEACAGLGSPFMAQMLTVLAKTWRADTALDRFCKSFEGDIGPGGASLPLRLAGALHAVALTGRDPRLQDHYPPEAVNDNKLESVLWAAIARHEAFIIDWMASPPQTNEVRRSAVLIAAANYICTRFDLPMVTSELGASAGLNLGWDRYGLVTDSFTLGPARPVLTLSPRWEGEAVVPSQIRVVERRGVDLNPIDPSDPLQRLRLFSYIWPDQPERITLTRAAIEARTAYVDRSDAVDWLETRLTQIPSGHLHLIYHTIAWQYFPAERQERGTALIESAGSRATQSSPLAWLSFEADGENPGASITLRLWPGDIRIGLGRADFHGRWVQWAPHQKTE